MKIQIRFFKDWEEYEVDAETVEDAAYAAVRIKFPFLTDDNHKTLLRREIDPLRLDIIKNENSPLYEGLPSWVFDGPDTLWFWVEFSTVPERKRKLPGGGLPFRRQPAYC